MYKLYQYIANTDKKNPKGEDYDLRRMQRSSVRMLRRSVRMLRRSVRMLRRSVRMLRRSVRMLRRSVRMLRRSVRMLRRSVRMLRRSVRMLHISAGCCMTAPGSIPDKPRKIQAQKIQSSDETDNGYGKEKKEKMKLK